MRRRDAVSGGDAAITLEGTSAVDEQRCAGSSYVTVFIEYATAAPDDNGNNVPDWHETLVGADTKIVRFAEGIVDIGPFALDCGWHIESPP